MNITKNEFCIDCYLIPTHIFLLILSFWASIQFPYISTSKDLILLLFLLISFCGLIALLLLLVGILPELKRTYKHSRLVKFFLNLLYWISTTFILIFSGITKFLHDSPAIVTVLFTVILAGSFYFSVIRESLLDKAHYIFLTLTIFIIGCLLFSFISQ